MSISIDIHVSILHVTFVYASLGVGTSLFYDTSHHHHLPQSLAESGHFPHPGVAGHPWPWDLQLLIALVNIYICTYIWYIHIIYLSLSLSLYTYIYYVDTVDTMCVYCFLLLTIHFTIADVLPIAVFLTSCPFWGVIGGPWFVAYTDVGAMACSRCRQCLDSFRLDPAPTTELSDTASRGLGNP